MRTDEQRANHAHELPNSRPLTWNFHSCFVRLIVHLFLDASTAPCASRSFFAQSSQHTSTVFPPILTLIRFASSLQSQAAHVLAAMTLPLFLKSTQEKEATRGALAAVKIFSDLFWEDLTVQRGPPEFRGGTTINGTEGGAEMTVAGKTEVKA